MNAIAVDRQTQSATIPLLMNFAVARTGKPNLPGRYDTERQVWIVDTAYGPEPLVRSDELKDIGELVTKTDVKAEKDDPGHVSNLELYTKTAHEAEKDDVSSDCSYLVELITLTKVGGEKPDVS